LARLSCNGECWPAYLAAASAGLADLAVSGRYRQAMDVAEAFDEWVRLTRDGEEHGQHLYFIGNGASATMASHFAADACKNAGLSAMAFNDAALLTATANDVAFDEVFAVPLRRLARTGDLLVAISSSGNSTNILHAIAAARSLSIGVVTLTGMCSNNRARSLGDLNFYVPAPRYGWVECAHQLVLHYWLDLYLNRYADGAI